MRRTSGRMLKKPAGIDSPAALMDKHFEHPAGTIPCCATQTDRLVFGFNMLFS
jgi:hypothetical protein